MKKIESLKLVGKCGLYCGACTIYRAERDSEEWRLEIAEKHEALCKVINKLMASCEKSSPTGLNIREGAQLSLRPKKEKLQGGIFASI